METAITDIETGKAATIIKLSGGYTFQRRLRTMGVREGKIIRVITKHPLNGPLVVEVENRKTTIGRRMAQRIMVEV